MFFTIENQISAHYNSLLIGILMSSASITETFLQCEEMLWHDMK